MPISNTTHKAKADKDWRRYPATRYLSQKCATSCTV